MNDSRGQSAVEHFLTYGWALVIIVVVLAVLILVSIPQEPYLVEITDCRDEMKSYFDETCSELCIEEGFDSGIIDIVGDWEHIQPSEMRYGDGIAMSCYCEKEGIWKRFKVMNLFSNCGDFK